MFVTHRLESVSVGGLISVLLKTIVSDEEATASKQCSHFSLTLSFDPFHIHEQKKDVPTPEEHEEHEEDTSARSVYLRRRPSLTPPGGA